MSMRKREEVQAVCYHNEPSAVSGSEAEPQALQDNDDSVPDPEFLMGFINRLRRLTLDRKPHIKQYYKIRKLHGEIVDTMVQYHENGKFKQEINADAVPQPKKYDKTLYLIESSFDFETKHGTNAFYDMLIYKSAPNTSCITEDFIRNHRYRKPEKIEFLHSMLDSKPGLFEVSNVDMHEGYAYLKEVFTGAEYKIVDVGLSGGPNYGDFYLYTRVITYQGISFGTGLNLSFTKSDGFIKNHIRHHKKDYSPNGEFLRFSQVYNRYCQNPDRVKVVANTL